MIAKEVSHTKTSGFASTHSKCRFAARPYVCQRISNAGVVNKHVSLMAVDDATMSFDPATLPPPASVTPIKEFEPILNVEAASSFVVIGIVFTLLQLRINAVSNAAKRRSLALEELRKAESLQLSASDVGIDPSDRPTENDVTYAKKEYEDALKEEMNLRTILPGVRIVAPNDPKRDEEERAAAKRFLGWGSAEFGDEPGDDDMQLEESSNGNDTQEKGISNSAKLILFGVGSMLLVLLLWTLSFDPMTPRSNMPLT